MRTTDPRAPCGEEQPKQHCVLPTVSSGLTALLVPAVIYGVEVLGVGEDTRGDYRWRYGYIRLFIPYKNWRAPNAITRHYLQKSQGRLCFMEILIKLQSPGEVLWLLGFHMSPRSNSINPWKEKVCEGLLNTISAMEC